MTLMGKKILQADIYAQLSEFFKEPTEEFADDIVSGRLLNYFKDVFSNLRIDTSLLNGLIVNGFIAGRNVYALLKNEYGRLFFGPIPPYIVPVESVYKRWSSNPECRLPITGEKGYLMGDPAVDIIRRYQAHGIVIPDKYSSMPDHIALELEYMSFLCMNGDIEKQREFFTWHLDWVDELAKDIKNIYGNSFYSTGAEITARIIRANFKNLFLNRNKIYEKRF